MMVGFQCEKIITHKFHPQFACTNHTYGEQTGREGQGNYLVSNDHSGTVKGAPTSLIPSHPNLPPPMGMDPRVMDSVSIRSNKGKREAKMA